MDKIRTAAQDYLRRTTGAQSKSSNSVLDTNDVPTNLSIQGLWNNIRANDTQKTTQSVCEDLAVVEIFLANRAPAPLSPDDENAVKALFAWAATAVLPSQEFVGAWEKAQLGDDDGGEGLDRFKTARLKSSTGTSVLRYLDGLIPIIQLEDQVRLHAVAALASFTNQVDPWTTEQAFNHASQLLDAFKSKIYENPDGSLAPLLGDILKVIVKPLFAKTRNIAITPAGRKNVHPVPVPRFDQSVFDEDSKPWKFRDVYSVTLLTWIVEQYRPSDHAQIEAQFPLLVPPILSLIDDDKLAYKAKGCAILNTLLSPLSEVKSDILRRTNLDSVFQDALSSCLLSIPTVTPENESIHLLSFAYPAFFSVIHTRYPTAPASSSSPEPTSILSAANQQKGAEADSSSRLTSLIRLLRHHILSSYTHISNPRPVQPISSSVPIASYPHPRLSTFLLTQLAYLIPQMGTYITPHLQEIVPLVTETLTNPFGTACLALLMGAARVVRALVMNAWMRVWRWRGEILTGVCTCWIHLDEDEADVRRVQGSEGMEELEKLRRVLKEVVKLLRIAVEEVAGEKASEEVRREIFNGVIDIDAEYRELVASDERLKRLLTEGDDD
ncbi:hypothetical protein VTO42DRAFT_3070 [Malbranchea cinnamomea]